MDDLVKLQALLGSQGAQGNSAVQEHLQAALRALQSSGAAAPCSDRTASRGRDEPGRSSVKFERDSHDGASNGETGARIPPLSPGRPPKKPRRDPSFSEKSMPERYGATDTLAAAAGAARARQSAEEERHQPDTERHLPSKKKLPQGKGPGADPQRTKRRSSQEDADAPAKCSGEGGRPVKPVATKTKGGGLYSSLLHVGLANGQGASGEQQQGGRKDRAPPKRLSSFVNNAFQKGELPGGLQMDTAQPKPSDVAGKANRGHETAAGSIPEERARRAVVRQNSNLTDSVITQRSLLGTADGQRPVQHPSMGSGMGFTHRLPHRSATGLQVYHRVQQMPPHASGQASERAPPGAPGGQVLWTGKIKHSSSGNMVELCTIASMLPAECADQFSSTLFLNELVLRDNVMLGRHQLINCSVQNPTLEQRQHLTMMARMKLTGVVKLQHCEFTICPVADVSGEVKLIGFLLVE